MTALFWALEAITSESSAGVYAYSFCAFMASIVLLAHLESIGQVAGFVIGYVLLAPFGLTGLTGMRFLVFGLFSFFASGSLGFFSLYWSKKKGKYWLGKPFLWFLLIWYTVVGVSLIPSAAIIYGLPGESVWWAIIAFCGLAGWFVSGLRISTPLMHLFGGVVYAFLLYLLAVGFPPSIAAWAYSTNLVVVYLRLLIPSIQKMLT